LDGEGRKVLQLSPESPSNGTLSFGISQLPPGIYFLNLWIGGKISSGKFIKQ
jgi:hypothetical protein